MTFLAVFLGLVLVPVMALSIELGRYFYAWAEIAKAADAAALAAAAEKYWRVFAESGNLIPTSQTWENAQKYVNLNDGYLEDLGIHAFVTRIWIAGSTVQIHVSVDLAKLYPSILSDIVTSETGQAAIRAFIQ
jgi:hypothetical protein